MRVNLSLVTRLNLLVGIQVVSVLGLAGAGLYAIGEVRGGNAAELQRGWVAATAAWIALFAVIQIWLRLSIRHSILRSVGAAAHVIARVSAGDLTARVDFSGHGETQKMLDGLQAMTGDLHSLVSEVSRAARSVADTSAQIAQGNLDLSQRTEEQASTLEQTASSMEELTSTVANNADNARQASQLAATASETARKGNEVVGDVVTTMDEILDASKKIADIVSVIDGIAFQTNILALNAAVEAARAGDQGRGFAVVAAEVRSLAHRTTAAAREIKTLIADSEQKVQAGSARVDEAGHTMVGVVLSFSKVSDLIAEIAAASQEQSQGIGQINTAVAQMEQVVQQNASLVEEATAATESMKEQAGGLLRIVSRFNLGAQSAPAAAARAAAGRAQPTPAKARPGAALPPAYTAIGGAKPRARGGQWEEF